MSRQRVYLMGRQAIIPKLEGAATLGDGKRETDGVDGPTDREEDTERNREFRFRVRATPL